MALPVTPTVMPASPTSTAMATLTNPSGTPTASSALTARLAQMFCRMTLFASSESSTR
jgi:hypothetical protein